jgi:hypothetical protein
VKTDDEWLRRGLGSSHLREAKVELVAARKMPYMALSPVLDAVRKAWNAFYHNLASLHSRFLTIILDIISLPDTAFLAASREEFKCARRKK